MCIVYKGKMIFLREEVFCMLCGFLIFLILSYVAHFSSPSVILKFFSCNIKKVSFENCGELCFIN